MDHHCLSGHCTVTYMEDIDDTNIDVVGNGHKVKKLKYKLVSLTYLWYLQNKCT